MNGRQMGAKWAPAGYSDDGEPLEAGVGAALLVELATPTRTCT